MLCASCLFSAWCSQRAGVCVQNTSKRQHAHLVAMLAQGALALGVPGTPGRAK